MIQKIDFLALMVDDLPQATNYYQEVIGLQVNEEVSAPGVYTQFFHDGDITFALIPPYPIEGAKPSFVAGVVVDDVDAQYAEWKAQGVELLDEPNDMPFGRTFLFRTEQGHVLRAYKPGE